MNRVDFESLIEVSAKRELTSAEKERLNVHLSHHPADRERWEEENLLNLQLRSIADQPISSNFTALVLAAAQREHRVPSIQEKPTFVQALERFFHRWAPRTVVASSMLLLGLFVYQQHRSSERVSFARNIATVSGMADILLNSNEGRQASQANGSAIPNIAVLEDFDAIQRLGQLNKDVDVDLLVALE